jgi:hypothetical protein
VFKIAAVLMAGAWAFSGWRNMPRLEQPYPAAAGVVIATCILGAYWAGTRHAAGKVIARAVAQADARADAQAAAVAGARASNRTYVVVNPAEGARARGAAEFGNPEWIGGAKLSAIYGEDQELAANYAAELGADQSEEIDG